jgi:HK97 gp10 family phage protein
VSQNVLLDDLNLRIKLRRILLDAGRKAGAGMAGHLQRKLNVSARVGTPGSEKARKAAAKKARRRVARFLFQASKPGEAPRKRTGTLQKSVAAELRYDLGRETLTVRVGTNVEYGRHLEYGTRKMAARPWLRPGLVEYGPTFNRVVLAEIRRQIRGGAI